MLPSSGFALDTATIPSAMPAPIRLVRPATSSDRPVHIEVSFPQGCLSLYASPRTCCWDGVGRLASRLPGLLCLDVSACGMSDAHLITLSAACPNLQASCPRAFEVLSNVWQCCALCAATVRAPMRTPLIQSSCVWPVLASRRSVPQPRPDRQWHHLLHQFKVALSFK